MKEKRWDWILATVAAAALLVHFWPMAYWSSLTLVILRVTAAFWGQLFFCRRSWILPVRLLPLLTTTLLALWVAWPFGSPLGAGYFWDYCSPALVCAAAWIIHRLLRTWTVPQLLGGAFLFCITVVPVCIWVLLAFGWPPVIGNFTAAHAMTQYAAQVHPEWEAEGGWADYNLVDGSHFLNFYTGEERHTLHSNWNGTSIRDEEREAALRAELGVDKAKRSVAPHADPYGYIFWTAQWSAKETEQPRIFLRVDLSDGSGDPVLDMAQMREKMADRAMEVYDALSPLAPVDKFAVHYTHWGADRREKGGQQWHQITVELNGKALKRENILYGPITTN